MATVTEFTGCAWLEHGFLSRNLAGGSRGKVGITVFSSLLHVVDVGTGYVSVLGLRVPLLTAMARRSWMHFKRTPLVWATESAYRCCE